MTQIANADALAALPSGTILRDQGGCLVERVTRNEDAAFRIGMECYPMSQTHRADFPMTVLLSAEQAL